MTDRVALEPAEGGAPARRPTRLLLSEPSFNRHASRIAEAVPGAYELVPVANEGPLPDNKGVEIAFISRDLFVGGTRFNLNARFVRFAELLESAPDLRWVHIFPAGADMPRYQAMIRQGLILTTSNGASSVAVAQTAIAGMLALARQFPRVADGQRRKAWEPLYGPREPRQLSGQTAVVLGTGPIGQEIGRLAQAFGLTTIGVRRDAGAAPPPGFDEVVGFTELLHSLPRADWLLLACPLTETTRGIVNAKALAAMPPGAQVVNVARGGVVDEAALLAALDGGHIAGAFMDVFAQEPLPADSPFWEQPNVIVSPHTAAATDGLPDRVVDIYTDNLQRWFSGRPLRNRVMPVAG